MNFDIHAMWTLWCISYTQNMFNIGLNYVNQLLGRDIDLNIFVGPR